MAVKLNANALQAALERAVRLADRNENLPAEWIARTEHVGDCPSKSYVAVLASALLARAAYGEAIDPRSIKARSGPRGFSARGSIKVLAKNARDFGYDLGVAGPEPLNNQPWFHADRADEIRAEQVRADTRDYLRAIQAYLKAIDAMTADEAVAALAAFIVSRRAVTEAKREAARQRIAQSDASLTDLGIELQSFVMEDPEGGRRGQALVAAALDCVFPRVELGGINDPDAFDVVAFRSATDEIPSPVVQVKQKEVGEDTAVLLAEMAAIEGATTGLLVAIASDQRVIDDQAVAAQVGPLGVTVLTLTSIPEFFSALAVFSSKTPEEIATRLPDRFAARLKEIAVRPETLNQLGELLESVQARHEDVRRLLGT